MEASYLSVPPEAFEQNLPPTIAKEISEMLQGFASPGYYAGADLSESHKLLDSKLTTLKEWFGQNKGLFSN